MKSVKDLLLSIFLIFPIVSLAQSEFITIWDLSSAPSLSNNFVGNNFTIEYLNLDDGVTTGSFTGNNSTTTYTFPKSGKYQLSITNGTGIFNGIQIKPIDAQKLLSVNQWGSSIVFTKMYMGFAEAINMDVKAIDVPNFIAISDIQLLFYNCTSLINLNGSISNWNMSDITNIYGLFWNCSQFNQPLDSWNTANIMSMSRVFFNASSFNQPLNHWNTAKVRDMLQMFCNALVFNQPLNNWNTSNVVTMESMFYNSSFNQPLNDWDTGKLTNIRLMFAFLKEFDQPLFKWNTSNVTNMEGSFYGCPIFNQPLNNWNTANVTNMSHMFAFTGLFNQPLNNWNTAKVTNMNSMFNNATNFNQPLNDWNTSNVTTMGNMFVLSSFDYPLDKWNTAKVTDMNGMFALTKFNQPINTWNTTNVTTMGNMFNYNGVFNQPLNNWNTSNVTDMSQMFRHSSSFNQSIQNWNTSNVKGMDNMFYDAISFNQPLNEWNLKSVNTLVGMLSYSGMDCSTYSTTLIGWAANPNTPQGLSLGAAKIYYGVEGQIARSTLINNKGWTITGDVLGNCAPLPVIFGSIGAVIKNGQLMINWSTLTEVNNDHFIVEISKDGKRFSTVKTITTKATSGNSSTPLQYEVSLPQNDMALLWLLLPAALGITLLLHQKRNKFSVLLTVLSLFFVLNSCSKSQTSETTITTASQNLWVRIAQVDKEGMVHYSKIIKATAE